ncbi:hypothetical protein CK203_093962 [Vitis vinifera]|uniref:Uncharacterized protein n=1 Tax=Vitis vinifera TaxID=29760 RepID=A0A438CKH9_VITVI|nr:hypothetical protein CK203_093962 [Vitis vinifera]
MRKKSGEERQLISSKFSLPSSQPLFALHFVLELFLTPCSVAMDLNWHLDVKLKSEGFLDVLKVYTTSNIKEELEVAKREFLQANVVVKKSRKVFLPKVLERFTKEASISFDDLKWVTKNVDKKLHDSIQKCIDHKTNKKASQIIEWLPYNSRGASIDSCQLVSQLIRVQLVLLD